MIKIINTKLRSTRILRNGKGSEINIGVAESEYEIRIYPTNKILLSEYVLETLDLSIREWRCPSCESVNGRDENAARNICAVGASTVRLGDVRRASPAIAV